LAVFLVDRRIMSLFSSERYTRGAADRTLAPYNCWNPGVFERALRIVHLASFLVAGLSRADQDLMWITDEDDVCANETQHRALVTLFANISSHYLPHGMRNMRLGTTRSDTGARDVEDLVSIADLAAPWRRAGRCTRAKAEFRTMFWCHSRRASRQKPGRSLRGWHATANH